MSTQLEELERYLAEMERSGRAQFFCMALSRAEISKNYRERAKRRALKNLVRVRGLELGSDDMDVLIDGGFLDQAEADDDAAIAFAIRMLFQSLKNFRYGSAADPRDRANMPLSKPSDERWQQISKTTPPARTAMKPR